MNVIPLCSTPRISHPKVGPQHLSRKAVVYLRQSSPKQVVENLQSQRLQFALRDKAIGLGFSEVDIIDDDLGSSAALGARVRKISIIILPTNSLRVVLELSSKVAVALSEVASGVVLEIQ